MAAPPCPASRMVEPSRTPAGIFTSIVFGLKTWPAPPHVGHGLLSFTPTPLHVGQVSAACNCKVRRPPRCASSRDNSSSASTSCPRLLRRADRPPRPNRSPKSKPPAPPPKPPNSKSLKSKPSGGGPPAVLWAPSHPGGGTPAPALTARQFSPY